MFQQQILVAPRRCLDGIPARAISGLFLIFAGGCVESDVAAPGGLQGDAAASMAVVASRGHIRGIEQLVEEFESAFQARDAVAYGNVYAEDADFVNPIGLLYAGRAAIVAVHTGLFANLPAAVTFTAELHDVRFLTGTIALVDVRTTLAGLVGPPPPFAVISPDGAVRASARWLVEKRGGDWQVLLSYHRGWWSE